MRRLACAAVAALALAAGLTSAAGARPFTLDDLLHEAAIDGAQIDPSGTWAVIQARAPYDSLGRYAYGLRMEMALGTLWLADLRRPGPAQPLLAEDVGPGLAMGGFSPSGRMAAIYRLTADEWTLGLVDVASGAVRWLAVAPDWSPRSRTLQWLSDDALLVLARTDGALPAILGQAGLAAARYPGRWAATVRGEASVKVLGSGAYLGLRTRAAPRALLRIDARTGAATELARGAFEDLEIAPDGRRVALLEAGADLQPRADGPAQGEAGTQTEAHQLVLIDLATERRMDPLPGVDALPTLMAWSPSGRSMLVYVRDPGALWSTGRLRVVDAASGAVRSVGEGLTVEMRFRPEVVGAGWMGEDPLAFGRPAGAGRADWYRLGADGAVNLTAALSSVGRTLAAVDAASLLTLVNGRVWRVDRAGRATRVPGARASGTQIARTSPPGRMDSILPAASWVTVQGRLGRAGDGRVRASALPAPDGDLLGVSPDGRSALVRHQDDVGRMQLGVLAGGGETGLLAVNAGLASTPAPRVLPVRHQGPDGQPLTSWLYLPAVAVGPPPPLVVVPYAGGRYPTAPKDHPGEPGYPISLRLLVAHGYAVLTPGLPPARDAEPMADLGPRILGIVRAAAAQPDLAGAFDPDRLALWGFSFGGYTVAAALAQSDAFKAGVAVSGPMELISKWSAMSPDMRAGSEDGLWLSWSSGNSENGQNQMLKPPWADPGRYVRNSPFFAADRIRAPLLLAHGDQDAIELAQSEAMFAALYRQSKDAILLTYWGESHGLASPGNIRDFYARAFAFLDEHLGPPDFPR